VGRGRGYDRDESQFLPGREPEPCRPALRRMVGEARPGWKSSWREFRNLHVIRLQEAPGGMVEGGHGNLITNLRLQQA
jgi:hypothetical protein